MAKSPNNKQPAGGLRPKKSSPKSKPASTGDGSSFPRPAAPSKGNKPAGGPPKNSTSNNNPPAADSGPPPPTTPTSPPPPPPLLDESDSFRKAAYAINSLADTDPVAAKKRWKMLKMSAKMDTKKEPPEISNADQIAEGTNTIEALLEDHVVLNPDTAHKYARFRPETRAATPEKTDSFLRKLKNKAQQVLMRLPHNYGTGNQKRYALTYAELFHSFGVNAVDLVEELDDALFRRLEDL